MSAYPFNLLLLNFAGDTWKVQEAFHSYCVNTKEAQVFLTRYLAPRYVEPVLEHLEVGQPVYDPLARIALVQFPADWLHFDFSGDDED